MPTNPVTTNVDTHVAQLTRAVDAALAAALAGDFPIDPILGREVSDLVSKAASLQKRHGLLLEMGIVAALRASRRFEVLSNIPIPITAAADSLVASTPSETLERIHLRYDAPVVRSVNLDFVVIDTQSGWAGGYDCKRGNGALTQRLLRPLVRDVECAGLLLRGFLRDRGYASIDQVTVGLIDIYGSSGVPQHLAVNLADLDDHFSVPVVSVLNAMNARLERAFRRAVPGLLAPVQAAVDADAAAPDPLSGFGARETSAGTATRTPTRLSGPPSRAGFGGRTDRPARRKGPGDLRH